jgi:hypothetical protein
LAHGRKNTFKKINLRAAGTEPQSALRGARWSYRGPFFPPLGVRCENKINYYIVRCVLQTNS